MCIRDRLKGADSDISTLDVAKAVSDLDKDKVLQQYQHFVGSADGMVTVSYTHLRLRITVIDPDKVNDALLKSTGASGVVHKGQGCLLYTSRCV